ncbi:hypothetical protein [Bradyrhizobium sp. Ash2021]|uniref:hypothetical protein n=1 Tax=Bradyrhizobium sp. Ash2021 TaxID=2954771 RepID=UPI002815A28E|nr:hypothetical protein [Bradyrhizobium sp. Ash2021]WMT75071.1 hypothetical protein NL528_01105 [Bradyrhizobium sp. Ash2021]
MADEFVGSHEKSRAGYGTNGDPTPSSVPLGKQPKLVEPKVAPPAASADPGEWQTRNVSAKPIATAHGMRNPNDHPAQIARAISRKK